MLLYQNINLTLACPVLIFCIRCMQCIHHVQCNTPGEGLEPPRLSVQISIIGIRFQCHPCGTDSSVTLYSSLVQYQLCTIRARNGRELHSWMTGLQPVALLLGYRSKSRGPESHRDFGVTGSASYSWKTRAKSAGGRIWTCVLDLRHQISKPAFE